MSSPAAETTLNGAEIAIIGMAGRFPGAADINAFWQNLRDGVEGISRFSDAELLEAGVDPALLRSPQYVKAGGAIEGIELFDAPFFGFGPREAAVLDPQHRLFLETAWTALESAGYNPSSYPGAIGVYAGAGFSTYLLHMLNTNPEVVEVVGTLQLQISNDKDFLSTLTAYKLDLRGPSMTVQTACSTSLVAVCLACQSLLNYQCDIALAGGSSVKVPHRVGYRYQEGGIFSSDGHCRAFDAQADGTVNGNGVGIVVLKRLSDALADGDTIHAVIKGTAINNDGAAKVNYTAPSVDGQAEVIAMAQAVAGVDAETIGYVETHGAGTALGDPIEIASLTQAFRGSTEARGFCAIGSVKSNIGHLDAAAGVAGLIKTVLALKHRQIPPSLHFTRPNPQIDFANSPFYVNTKLSPWSSANGPLRAGVSSFGVGGTNAHVVLEEAPPLEPSDPPRHWQALLLSARTESALEQAMRNLTQHLKSHPEDDFADVCYTLQVGRRSFKHRALLICRDRDDALSALEDAAAERVLRSAQETSERPIIFMFSGLGDHYVNMALELYQSEPLFRTEVDRCAALLEPLLGLDIRSIIYPQGVDAPISGAAPVSGLPKGFNLSQILEQATPPTDENTRRLNQTWLAQPIVFTIEYALASLLMAWGIQPRALIGYSLGEYVAACLAGVFSLEDALRLVARRARLIDALPGGAMLSVLLPEAKLQPLLDPELSLAAINGPMMCVVSGPTAAITAFQSRLTQQGIAARQLPTTHAFHSAMMEPIVAEFTAVLRSIHLNPPRIPYVSNISGTWITAAQATDPSYWARHLVQPVRLADGLQTLEREAQRILVEIGPGQGLSTLARQQPRRAESGERIVLNTLRAAYDQQSDVALLLNTLGKLWLAGTPIDWEALYANEKRRRIPLPTYPFERQRCWIDALPAMQARTALPRSTATATQDRLSMASWKQALRPAPAAADALQHSWLVFADAHGFAAQLAERLATAHRVIRVQAGERFSRSSATSYTLNPALPSDYAALLADLAATSGVPERIIHGWGLNVAGFDTAQTAYSSLLALAQTLGMSSTPRTLWLLSNGLQAVESSDDVDPSQALLLSALALIKQRYAQISCRSIDLRLPSAPQQWAGLVGQLVAELSATPATNWVAYRGQRRWVQHHAGVDSAELVPTTLLRHGGTYVISDGLARDGLLLGQLLARSVQARLVLLSQATPEAQDQQALRHLEAAGAKVTVLHYDPTAPSSLHVTFAHIVERYGAIQGVLVPLANAERDSDSLLLPTHALATVQFLEILAGLAPAQQAQFYLLHTPPTTSNAAIADAFATRQNQFGAAPWVRVNWDLSRLAAASTSEWAEAVTLLQRILALNVAGATLSVDADAAPPAASLPLLETRAADEPPTDAERDELRTTYVAPRNPVEQTIATIWQRLLGVEQIGIYDSFFDLGGNSLQAPQLLAQVNTTLQVEVPLAVMLAQPTVAALAGVVAQIQREGSAALAGNLSVDLAAEVELDPAIDPRGLPMADFHTPHAIFLTGATGFLGAFLLHEIMQQTKAQIHCLVRASNSDEGKKRIQRNLQNYRLWDERYAERIVPVIGDQAQLRFGLSEAQFHTLASQIDVIYHCGAWVNFTYPYSALKAANVLSVQEALRLASCVRVKPLHFISSVAVFTPLAYTRDPFIVEDNDLPHNSGFVNSYGESKWVAEKICGLGRARGIPVAIYRPGTISGHSKTGIGNPKDMIWNLFKGCIQLGVAPDVATRLDITPVDFISRAIVQLSQQPTSLGKAFHFPNPEVITWRRAVHFLREMGYPIRFVSTEEWREVLHSVVAHSPDNALYPFVHMVSETLAEAAGIAVGSMGDTEFELQFDDRNTRDGLQGSAITCPPFDTMLLKHTITAFIQSGFLAAPPAQRSPDQTGSRH